MAEPRGDIQKQPPPGMPELGATLSCNRDFALIHGFNEDATLERTQTIMSGATHCDFRYNFKPPPLGEEAIELDVRPS